MFYMDDYEPHHYPTVSYKDLARAMISREATLDVDRAGYREYTWDGVQYACAWSPMREDWIIAIKEPNSYN